MKSKSISRKQVFEVLEMLGACGAGVEAVKKVKGKTAEEIFKKFGKGGVTVAQVNKAQAKADAAQRKADDIAYKAQEAADEAQDAANALNDELDNNSSSAHLSWLRDELSCRLEGSYDYGHTDEEKELLEKVSAIVGR